MRSSSLAARCAAAARVEVAARQSGHGIANVVDRTDQAALNEDNAADHHDGRAAGESRQQDKLQRINPGELALCLLGMPEIRLGQSLELLVERLAYLAVGVVVAELPGLGRGLLARQADQLGTETD